MTEKLDSLPEIVIYGGHKAAYVGTTTFKDSGGCQWYRHEYTYCDTPHVLDPVCFYRIAGDDEPIPEVTEFELARDPEPRRRASKRKSQKRTGGFLTLGAKPEQSSAAPIDDATAQGKMRDVLAYLDERRNKRNTKRQQQADKKIQIDLARRIRGQVKPFGGE